ncbi:MAG: ATP-binding protein [Desulfobacterales bacterium]|jgi:PAS domain S-box-containing protein
MILSSVPIFFIDILGSILMIILSFLCLLLAHELRSRDRDNVMGTYLLWVCFGLTGFAMSRSVGHILKQVLLMSGQPEVWDSIRPYSGAINSLMFVLVGSVTLFFERIWEVYRQISKDKKALQIAHEKLIFLNQNLEQLVAERTEELALSEHKYRRIFEVSKDMILVAKKDGLIVDLNPVGKNILGYPESDGSLDGRRFQEFFSRQTYWNQILHTIEAQGFISNFEADLKHRNGMTIRALISGSLDKGPEDEEDTIHFLVKDIEQRRVMEKQMAQAEKLASIGQLSAGVAHEINNPLGIILGYTQLLLRNEGNEEERQNDLRTIVKHARSCKLIVEDLLNFAREPGPKKSFVEVHGVIDEVLNFMQYHSDLGATQIVSEFDPRVPPIELDEKQIKQVLINLIMNAQHAVGNNGTIKVITKFNSADKKLSINVIDTGYGIEKKNLSRIFDPFFTTKPTGEGTGLGLSVSYGIIKNHGGDISVESKPGKGSTFTITLPVISPDKGSFR